MAHITVIGSGPSGVHFALTALQQGHRVEMIDVGNAVPETVNPGDTFNGLKNTLEDPAAYFLGAGNEGVLLPGEQESFYSMPPSKAYATQSVPWLKLATRDFAPMFSFARGGLAEMWTGGSYPFNDGDLAEFPFDLAALEPWYSQVAGHIGINGAVDDLADFLPVHANLQEPLRLDEHSAMLLSRYHAQRDILRERLGCYLGRARQAVLSSDFDGRKACDYTGRCIWGCPTGAIYTASMTLEDCQRMPGFTYHPGNYATHFNYDENDRIGSVAAISGNTGEVREFPVDTLVLASGALGSSRIFLESVYRGTGKVIRLPGLMDNRQVLVPFLNLRMIGRQYQADSYQYNQLAMGMTGGTAAEYVHCLITTLKTSMIHPVVEKFPVDLRTGLQLFRGIHAALGVVNVNFHDTRRDDCYLTLDTTGDTQQPELVMRYTPPRNEMERIDATLHRLKKVLWKLGCIVPPGMVQMRSMGAGVHYAGTLPMSETRRPLTLSANCKSHDFSNLYIVDGAGFPFLPAKNITFTLMANAARVAASLDR